MIEMKLPRQPKLVRVSFFGDQRDIDRYIAKIKRALESTTLDNVERENNHLKIYPGAVNE